MNRELVPSLVTVNVTVVDSPLYIVEESATISNVIASCCIVTSAVSLQSKSTFSQVMVTGSSNVSGK